MRGGEGPYLRPKKKMLLSSRYGTVAPITLNEYISNFKKYRNTGAVSECRMIVVENEYNCADFSSSSYLLDSNSTS